MQLVLRNLNISSDAELARQGSLLPFEGDIFSDNFHFVDEKRALPPAATWRAVSLNYAILRV